MKKRLLVIAGPSGCGKNYITDLLIGTYPELFQQLPQYTTREKRTPDENTYHFISKSHYDVIEHALIAKTEINGYHYGTVPSFEENKIGIIIANKKGIESLREYLSNNTDNVEVFYLGIDSEQPKERDERTKEYVANERKELKPIINDWLVNIPPYNYITAEDVYQYLENKKFI
ncbi:guanylate kinase [Bacillus phage AR9]|uniref:Guanylate kinase n=2 Tax=Bacillus phage PBS1 TaxID=10683 RepID=A0A172JIE8_BPPB1|nr:guanylate kinase [Bacillus phage AR9]YP_009664331.1 guanylate kinase [Bacillus phage PBS1]QXN70160.1 putative guanylate kinase [Bacillus phage vB_BspM_Internexus]WCS68366.1 guanylate kinase [Bacillus phage vB_BsuM-Goe21]AMS01322.1 guanylate kinase [Bacillus phage AR9]AST99951.1 guanylate kinase [Bacillus phage PBS1]BDE75533.1 hypothetical protein [Bacillus phage PBS1]